MNSLRGAVVIIMALSAVLPMSAQVGSPGGATVGIGINRRGFQVCWTRSDGVTCQSYTFGPCGACHDLKPNAIFDEKAETAHQAKYWLQFQQNIAPGKSIQFGGISVRLMSGNYVAFDTAGIRLASFPTGTRILDDQRGGLWIFFPRKPPFILSQELEQAIKNGLPALK